MTDLIVEGEETYNFETLRDELLRLSYSQDWPTAVQEWDFVGSTMSEDWTSCVCTHAIKEMCHIVNRITLQTAIVGNVCVNRFLGIQTTRIAKMVQLQKKDPATTLPYVIVHAMYDQNLIDKQSFDFYVSILNHVRLTPKQFDWFIRINNVFLGAMRQGHLRLTREQLESMKGMAYGFQKVKNKRKFVFGFEGTITFKVETEFTIEADTMEGAMLQCPAQLLRVPDYSWTPVLPIGVSVCRKPDVVKSTFQREINT